MAVAITRRQIDEGRDVAPTPVKKTVPVTTTPIIGAAAGQATTSVRSGGAAPTAVNTGATITPVGSGTVATATRTSPTTVVTGSSSTKQTGASQSVAVGGAKPIGADIVSAVKSVSPSTTKAEQLLYAQPKSSKADYKNDRIFYARQDDPDTPTFEEQFWQGVGNILALGTQAIFDFSNSDLAVGIRSFGNTIGSAFSSYGQNTLENAYIQQQANLHLSQSFGNGIVSSLSIYGQNVLHNAQIQQQAHVQIGQGIGNALENALSSYGERIIQDLRIRMQFYAQSSFNAGEGARAILRYAPTIIDEAIIPQINEVGHASAITGGVMVDPRLGLRIETQTVNAATLWGVLSSSLRMGNGIVQRIEGEDGSDEIIRGGTGMISNLAYLLFRSNNPTIQEVGRDLISEILGAIQGEIYNDD